MFRWFAMPFGIACLFVCAAVAAAPPSLPPSLVAALRAIWDESPEVAQARAEVDAARSRARAAGRPLYNPTVSLEAENADVDRRTAGIGLTLDLSGKRRARGEFGDAGWRVAEAGYATVRRDVALRWLKAWSAVSLAERQLALGESRLASMTRFDELAEKRLRTGDISRPERDLAGLAVGEAWAQQAQLVAEVASARASLAVIGEGAATNLPPLPTDLPPAAATVAPRDIRDLPEWIQAQAEVRRAEAGVDVARRDRRPDPTVSLTGGTVRSGSRQDAVVGVSVSMPLPIRNSGRAETEAAHADVAAASAGIAVRELALRARLRESEARYAALHAAATAFRAGRASAFGERTALLETLWRSGEIATSDYLVQLKQSLDTALSGVALESQVWQAWFDYLSASGRLIEMPGDTTEEASP
jgi:cobalt-zinc-cadmium efflux system outer membrane protein